MKGLSQGLSGGSEEWQGDDPRPLLAQSGKWAQSSGWGLQTSGGILCLGTEMIKWLCLYVCSSSWTLTDSYVFSQPGIPGVCPPMVTVCTHSLSCWLGLGSSPLRISVSVWTGCWGLRDLCICICVFVVRRAMASGWPSKCFSLFCVFAAYEGSALICL